MRIAELEKVISHHNKLYFEKHKPEISDFDFDRLVEELKKLKPDSKVLDEIGSDLTKRGKKIRHDVPMLSLDKCYDDKTLREWRSKFQGAVIASPKVDGLAVSLKYDKNGRLAQASTRGNGVVGEEITQNVKEIRDIPQKIAFKDVEIRGEIYMPLSVFKKFKDKFSNPRNLAAGAVKQKDPKKTAAYELRFLAYDVLGLNSEYTHDLLEKLKKEKIIIIENKQVVDRGKIEEVCDTFFKERSDYDFETDGIVFKADLISEQKRLGNTAHHPRYAIAYKFQGESGVTTLREIEWSVSRSGLITPIGIVDPIELSGAIVKRSSLHNIGWLKKIGATPNSKVVMMRRGGVIPHLEEVVETGSGKVVIPKRCPSCGGDVEERDDFLYCKNSNNCVKSKVGELLHFIQTIECDGFGDKLVEQLYTTGLVTDADEFYSLTEDELMRLERMGETLSSKLLSNIEARRELALDVFLRSLGIRELGKSASQILLQFKTLKRIRSLTVEELSTIHGFGEVIAADIVNGLKKKSALIDKLLKQVKLIEGEGVQREGKFFGKTFLFTGSLSAMTRSDAIRRVEEHGGRSASTVTKDVDYLVVGDEGSVGSKLDKAKRLKEKGGKVEIISESEFVELIK